jgi:predicted transcriptional regulator
MLAELAQVNESTLRYHIFRIEKERCITVHESGLSGRILHLISESPGITRKKLADKLEVASPTVTRAVQNIYNESHVTLVREGKFPRHYLSQRDCNLMSDHTVFNQNN